MYNPMFGESINAESCLSTVPKNDLITVLLYFGEFSIQIRTGINRVMKNNKLPTSIFEFYSRLSAS